MSWTRGHEESPSKVLNDDSPLDGYVFCLKDEKPNVSLKKGSITVGSFGVT